ncbi:MAG: threonine synthase [Bacteroidota bacterium]
MLPLTDTQTYFSYLQCSLTGERYSKERLQTYSVARQPLVAHYNFDKEISKEVLLGRPNSMWRYQEFLPVHEKNYIVSLGEGMTPILPFQSAKNVFLKDEALNPTGSFKARGLSMAISKAKELGVRKCVIPTAGNAGGAMSAYCARAGLEAFVYMPTATPKLFQQECQLLGAKVTLVDGTIADCAAAIKEENEKDWFDISTLKEPYRLEGKKTMGLEIAEQMNWELPDVIIYPTGGGTGLLGIWKAFSELEELGWIHGPKPKMVVVQVEACHPIVQAWEQNQEQAVPFDHPGSTIANGLRVPAAFGDRMILQVLRESKGYAITVSEQDMQDGIKEVATNEGILLSPEGSAVWMAYKKLLHQEKVSRQDKVLLINTGSLYKYMENL